MCLAGTFANLDNEKAAYLQAAFRFRVSSTSRLIEHEWAQPHGDSNSTSALSSQSPNIGHWLYRNH